MQNIGIYCIYFNTDNCKYYIGQSINLDARIQSHNTKLRKGTHPNLELQEAYNIFGTPSVEILEFIDELAYLDIREQYWIKEFDSYTGGYNHTSGGKSAQPGAANPYALYSKEIYLNIAHELLSNLTYRQIAAKLSVSDRVVASIATGQSHSWIKEENPELYAQLLAKKGSRSISTEQIDLHTRIFFRIVNTDDRLCDIAKDENINKGVIEKMVYGATCTYLKDKYPEEYRIMVEKSGTRRVKAARQKEYPALLSPDGVIHHIINAREFCRNNNLQQSNLGKVINGTAKTHKGWTLV